MIDDQDELQKEILKNALARKAKGEQLSTVEAVVLREYELALEIRKEQRKNEQA